MFLVLATNLCLISELPILRYTKSPASEISTEVGYLNRYGKPIIVASGYVFQLEIWSVEAVGVGEAEVVEAMGGVKRDFSHVQRRAKNEGEAGSTCLTSTG